VLLTGGHDDGAIDPLRNLARAVAAAGGDRQRMVLYAGNAAARDSVAAELAGTADFVIVDNVSPRPGETASEAAGLELHRYFLERGLGRVRGYDRICAQLTGELETAADGFWSSLRFLASQEQVPVLGV